MSGLRVGIDIGGTFVDAIRTDPETGGIRLEKALTTPEDPVRGVLDAIAKLDVDLADVSTIVHGTTLGLNAILERRGAHAGILTNAGFRDVFEIGRGDLPHRDMYNLHYQRDEPLVRRRDIAEAAGRIDVDGNVVEELDEAAVIAEVGRLVETQNIESLAISFLHAYRNPVHEERAAALVAEHYPDLPVSISSRVAREHREYERLATTVLDAYIRPIFERYINRLEQSLQEAGFAGRFLVMRSSGGAMTAEAARDNPLDSVFSGPAGGILGAADLATRLDIPQLLTMDFGGTSLDACVIEDGQPPVIHETRLQHLPVLIATYDIRCIGAGGGSIAWLEHGLLRLGPHSAGADPGPACYGRGGERPALTDAAVILGYVDPERFLKGALTLDTAAADRAMREQVAEPLGTSITEAAAGAFSVLAAQTVGAIREITVERGKDPREFSCLAFGGAGPLIAPLVALEMGIAETIIPQAPSAFSAYGMLTSRIAADASQTFVAGLDETVLQQIQDLLDKLAEQAARELVRQGVTADERLVDRFLELRYAGQEHTLKVPVANDGLDLATIRSDFDRHHETWFGHRSDQPLELVNLRVLGVGGQAGSTLSEHPDAGGKAKVAPAARERKAWCFRRRETVQFGVYDRADLRPGMTIEGPAIIDEGTSTTVFYTGQSCAMDAHGHLVLKTA
ncbi:hydantoinase/oxoprolinase family protein [Elongatibacter sediminis]|uniref:Hydantoinase/oxoprolinase family protein n=1 Tax=Elongatibacter sediminis TaxID=3119006 RepID=A0AAW9R6E1_9GAMM